MLCTSGSGVTALKWLGGNGQSIGSTVSVAIVRSWLTLSSPLRYFSSTTEIVS